LFEVSASDLRVVFEDVVHLLFQTQSLVSVMKAFSRLLNDQG
jgi:hypothetical protein